MKLEEAFQKKKGPKNKIKIKNKKIKLTYYSKNLITKF